MNQVAALAKHVQRAGKRVGLTLRPLVRRPIFEDNNDIYYYPAADRNSAGVIFENAAVGIGAEAIGNLFQEFVARRFIRNKR